LTTLSDYDVRPEAVHGQGLIEATIQLIERGLRDQQPRIGIGELVQRLGASGPLGIARALVALVEPHQARRFAEVLGQPARGLLTRIERRRFVAPDRDFHFGSGQVQRQAQLAALIGYMGLAKHQLIRSQRGFDLRQLRALALREKPAFGGHDQPFAIVRETSRSDARLRQRDAAARLDRIDVEPRDLNHDAVVPCWK
jgi:hypothetical protein